MRRVNREIATPIGGQTQAWRRDQLAISVISGADLPVDRSDCAAGIRTHIQEDQDLLEQARNQDHASLVLMT